jgi:hypothetical protein
MRSSVIAYIVAACILPIVLYLPLVVANGELQVRGFVSSATGDLVWAVIWLGSTAVGYAAFVRHTGRAALAALVYFPAMLALLGYIGLVTGLYLYGDGP